MQMYDAAYQILFESLDLALILVWGCGTWHSFALQKDAHRSQDRCKQK